MSEPVLLSFHDSLLHESDGELLQGPHWLNDTLLQFHLDYLRHVTLPDADLGYVGPDVTQFARLCPESDLAEFLAPLSLQRCRGALFVINDCERPDAAGGTHWSLLVWAGGKRFIHYDSLAGGNQGVAKLLARRLATVLKCSAKVEQATCGRQQNGHDCGLYVVEHAEAVARRLAEGSEDLLTVRVTPERVQQRRGEMLRLIHALAAEGRAKGADVGSSGK